MVWGLNPGRGKNFCTCPDRPWGPPSLLYIGYRFFTGGRSSRGMVLTTHPLLAPRLRMSRAIPLLPLWALGGLLQCDLYITHRRACQIFNFFVGIYSHLKVNQQAKKTFQYLVIAVCLVLCYVQPHYIHTSPRGSLYDHETEFCCHRL
jgi:hypothetical protein